LTDPERTTASGPASEAASPQRLRRRKTGRFECQLGLLIGLLGLVASRLGQLWIAFDVFSQFTLQFVAITFAFLVGVLLPRARLLAAFMVLMAGLAGIGVWPHIASREPRPIDVLRNGETPLKVATFNTWFANDQPDRLKAEIERLDSDIITLVELAPGKRPMLDALLARYPYQATCFDKDFCNLAILSKLPILGHEARVNWEGPPLMTAKFELKTGGLTVIAVHTIRFPHSRAQFRQVLALDGFVETIPGSKLIMGDFNATPFSRIIAAVAGRTGMTRLTMLPSWPSHLDLPQMAIDHIFVTPDIRAISGEAIGNPAGSDHYPVTMTLAVAPGRS
jgi:endonuclease/exonuclease/phosphatase (EEP) superfamily protein YafD